MKVLLTGANGQLGRQLLARVPEGVSCISTDRSRLDITDARAVDEFFEQHRPHLVLNAAAYTAVDLAENDESTAFSVNGSAVGHLAKAAGIHNAHLVHVSSDFVFDGMSSRAYRPNDACNPLSAYGRSKLAGERAAGPGATVIRTSWVYAAQANNFVGTMLKLMRECTEVKVVADQIGAPTWAVGLAETIWKLGVTKQLGIWHHCDAGVASWYDFAVAIAEDAIELGLLEDPVSVVPVSSNEYVRAAPRPNFSLLDTTETRSCLGMPAIHWRDNLRRMLKQEAEVNRVTERLLP